MRPPDNINFPPWHEIAGDVPYTYRDMPAGSRCAWACKWATSKGVIIPSQWGNLEDMTAAELIAELEDITVLGFPGAAEMLEAQRYLPPQTKVKNYLRKKRESYPEMILPTDPPALVFQVNFRPGWGEAQVLQMGMRHASQGA